jgi:membrane fusion protein, peptide pheromone/bacteriocin exporter
MNFSSDPINNLENLIYQNKTKSFSIYLVLVLAVIVCIALLPIIKVDISSQSRGIIRSTTDNVPVTSIVSGRVTWVRLHNNNVVKQGDTLIKISKQSLDTERNTQDTLATSVVGLLSDVSLILQGNTSNLQTASAREDFLKFQTQKSELQSKVAQAQTNYNRNKGLYDKDIIAKVEYEKYQFELRLANQALQSFVSQQKATWQNQKRELEERVKNINGSISKINADAKNYLVLAPISGTIESFSGLQVGSNVVASQPIATISATSNLIVESNVSPSDIGLIQKNQKVKFQLDAFNYNQWGLLEGKVIDIDRNITIQGEQAFFKVRSAMNTNAMQLQSGYKTEVSKGMTLTTRYTITRRSLYQLLFDKVDDWLNPASPTPPKEGL